MSGRLVVGRYFKISQISLTCAHVNAKKDMLPQEHWGQGTVPSEFGVLDFTNVKQGLYGYKYLLVLC